MHQTDGSNVCLMGKKALYRTIMLKKYSLMLIVHVFAERKVEGIHVEGIYHRWYLHMHDREGTAVSVTHTCLKIHEMRFSEF